MKFIAGKTAKERSYIAVEYPGYIRVDVEGGYMIFENPEELRVWKMQK